MTTTNTFLVGTYVYVRPTGLFYGYGQTPTEQFGIPAPFYAWVSATRFDGSVASLTTGLGQVHLASFGNQPMTAVPPLHADHLDVLRQLHDDYAKRATWTTIPESFRDHHARIALALSASLA